MKASRISLAIIAAAGLLAFVPSMQAQTNDSQTPSTETPRRRGGMNPQARLAAFEAALGSTNKLTDTQLPQVKSALEEQSKDMRDLMGQRNTLSQEDLRSKRKAMNDEFKGKMKAILTPEQYKVWEQSSRRGKGARRKANANSAATGAAAAQ